MAILDDVRAVIAKSLHIPVEQVTADTRLDALGVESLDVIEIIFGLEEKFDIAIPLKAADAASMAQSGQTAGNELPFSTVGDVAEMVQKLVMAKAPQ